MILGFMQAFPWKVNGIKEPTNFREKILAGAGKVHPGNYRNYLDTWRLIKDVSLIPKLHTLREDPHNRWKAGRKIEMVYRGAGYKILDHFNKGIPELETCVSTQKVEIKWLAYRALTSAGMTNGFQLNVFIDGKRFVGDDIKQIAANDGFADINQFARWFKTEFSGKILHFSSLRY